MGCGCSNGDKMVQKFRVVHNGKTVDFLTAGAANDYRTANGIKEPARVVKVKA